MARAQQQVEGAVSGGGAGSTSGVLGVLDATGVSDHVDTLGYNSRLNVVVENGAGSPVTFELEHSCDASVWAPVVLGVDSGGDAVVSRQVSAAGDEILCLDPEAVARFLRVRVTAANGDGTAFTAYAER